MYDTAWALGLALNNSLKYLNTTGLDQYSNNPYYLNAIIQGMHEVNFAGLSVSILHDFSRRAFLCFVLFVVLS